MRKHIDYMVWILQRDEFSVTVFKLCMWTFVFALSTSTVKVTKAN